MDTIIDLFNNTLIYNSNKIDFLIDIENNKQQGGGYNNIIDNVIDNYKKKYEYYNNLIK